MSSALPPESTLDRPTQANQHLNTMDGVEMSLVGLLVAVELGLDLFKRKPSRLRDQKIFEGHSSPSNGRKLPRGTICVRNMMVFLFLGSYCTC